MEYRQYEASVVCYVSIFVNIFVTCLGLRPERGQAVVFRGKNNEKIYRLKNILAEQILLNCVLKNWLQFHFSGIKELARMSDDRRKYTRHN